MAPALWGPALRGWGGDGTGGHGCVADRFLASSARPWVGGWAQDGPPGSPGLGGSLGRPRQGPWCPGPRSCPSGVPPPAHSPQAVPSACPQAAWSLLHLQEAVAFLQILALPNLCAAATESIFFKNRMDVRKTTIPQNHTQGVDRAGSLALNNRAATSLMGNKNKQPTQGTRAGDFHTQQPPVGTWVPGPRRQECGGPGEDCLPPQPLPGTHPGKGHLEVVPPVEMEEVRSPSPSWGRDPLW